MGGKSWIFSLIAGIIGILALFTPASHAVLSIYGINFLSWHMWMFGFHYYYDYEYGLAPFWTADTYLLMFQIAITIIVFVVNLGVLILALGIKESVLNKKDHSLLVVPPLPKVDLPGLTPDLRPKVPPPRVISKDFLNRVPLKGAIVLIVTMIIYIVVLELWSWFWVGESFWGLLFLGFAIIGQFIASGLMLIGFFIANRASKYQELKQKEYDAYHLNDKVECNKCGNVLPPKSMDNLRIWGRTYCPVCGSLNKR